MTQPLVPVDLFPSLVELDAAFTQFNARRTLMDSLTTQIGCADVGGAQVLSDPARPEVDTYNRVLGLSGANLGQLDEMLGRLPGPTRVDLAARSTDEGVSRALIGRGLVPHFAMTYLVRRPARVDLRPRGVRVRRLGSPEADGFLDLLVRAYGPITDEVRGLRKSLYCSGIFRCYLATVDDQPAGWATMFVHNDAAIFANAFTFERFRRRGCQSALFAERLGDAERLGLSWVSTDVLPGVTSHRNAERAGFRAASTVTIWRPPTTGT